MDCRIDDRRCRLVEPGGELIVATATRMRAEDSRCRCKEVVTVGANGRERQ